MNDDCTYRDATGRLAFSIEECPADRYKPLCKAACKELGLIPKGNPVSNGSDITFQEYERGDQVVGLEWDNWMGYTVVAKSPESEHLVLEIATWLIARHQP